MEDEGRSPCRTPTENASWSDLDPVSHDREYDVALRYIVATQPEPTPMTARTTGIRDQFVAGDAYRVVALGFFDRRVLGVLGVGLDPVHAVAASPRTVPTPHSLVEDKVLTVPRIDATEGDATGRALGVSHRLFRRCFGQGTQGGLTDAQASVGAGAHRRRSGGVADEPGGRDNLNEAIESVVNRNVGINLHAQRIGAGSKGHGDRGVHGTRTLPVTPREIEPDPLVIDIDPDHDADRLAAEAVVFEAVDRLVSALPEISESRSDTALGVVEDILNGLRKSRRSHRSQYLAETGGSHLGGGDLCIEVAARFARCTHVPEDQLDDTPVYPAADHELGRRNDQTFLDLFLVQADTTRRTTADIEVMGHRRRVADQFIIGIDRHDNGDIVQVDAAEIGVVANKARAGGELDTMGCQYARHEVHHRAQMRGLPEDWAITRARASSSTQEWSSLALMLVEKAERCSTTLISSAIASRRLRSALRAASGRATNLAQTCPTWQHHGGILQVRGLQANRHGIGVQLSFFTGYGSIRCAPADGGE